MSSWTWPTKLYTWIAFPKAYLCLSQNWNCFITITEFLVLSRGMTQYLLFSCCCISLNHFVTEMLRYSYLCIWISVVFLKKSPSRGNHGIVLPSMFYEKLQWHPSQLYSSSFWAVPTSRLNFLPSSHLTITIATHTQIIHWQHSFFWLASVLWGNEN
jgi:hypothetical protein